MRAEPTILPLRLSDVVVETEGRRLLDRVSLTLDGAGLTAIMGPNGAGKSLTLRVCHGLLRPASGTVRWLGPAGPSAEGRHAMVFQRPVLLRRSARANLVHALALAGHGWRARRDLADEALARFGLEALAESPARVLSGGEQHRLALARAWTLRPQVLFLDEPTANLDPGATRAVEALVRDFRAEGTKVVMTTHDLGQARRLAEEVVFLDRGRVREHAPAEAFFSAPATAEAAAFIRGDLPW